MELLSSVKYNIKDPELYCVVLWLWNCVADIYAGLLLRETKMERLIKNNNSQLIEEIDY